MAVINNERLRRMLRPDVAVETWLFLGGWQLLTAGIAACIPTRALAVVLLADGLLVLTTVGWRVILEVVCAGLYVPEPVPEPAAPPLPAPKADG